MFKLEHNFLIFYYKDKAAYEADKEFAESLTANKLDIRFNRADVVISPSKNKLVSCLLNIEDIMDKEFNIGNLNGNN